MMPPPLPLRWGRGGGGTRDRAPTCAAVLVMDPSTMTKTAATRTMIMTTTMSDYHMSSRGMSCAIAIDIVLIEVNGHNEAM
jgi:hypothetical protein